MYRDDAWEEGVGACMTVCRGRCSEAQVLVAWLRSRIMHFLLLQL
jgi:hypothetical protein